MSSDDDFLISLLPTAQLRMRPKDTVVFAVIKSAIVMENITKEYTLLAEVVSNLCLQHMRLVSRTEHKEISPYTKLQHCPVEAEKLELCTSLFCSVLETLDASTATRATQYCGGDGTTQKRPRHYHAR